MPDQPAFSVFARPPSRIVASMAGVVMAAAGFLILRSGIALNHDSAWLMVAAGRLMSGGHYASDFFEVNMPQAIMLYGPPQWLHDRMGLSGASALTVWVAALSAQCLGLIAVIGSKSGRTPLQAMTLPWWQCWLALGLLALPGNDFGQREHLATILSLPFVFALGAEPGALTPAFRSYVAVLAAIGFYTKPHFAPLPWLLLVTRPQAGSLRAQIRSPEVQALVMVALLEALVLALRFPDWFGCARWAGDLYGAFRQPSFWYLFEDSSVGLSAIVLTALGTAGRRNRSLAAPLQPFFIAALYSAVVYLVQGKGWPYQFLPAMLFLFAAVPLAWGIANSRTRVDASPVSQAAVALAMLALVVQAGVAIREAPRAADLPHSLIGTAFSAARPGDSVYVFSTAVTGAFPTVVDLDLGWASRFSALWPLAGIAAAMPGSDPRERMKRLRYAQPLADAVNEDFRRYQPSIVLVDHRPHAFGLPPHFDILGFFLRDPAFLQTWSGYELIGTSSDYDVYRTRSRARDPLPPGWRATP